MTQLTVAERAEADARSAGRCPGRPTATGPRPRAPRPGGLARGAGRRPRAVARADPPRPDAGLPVHLLPGGGPDHGRRPGLRRPPPASTSSSAVTPTCRTSVPTRHRNDSWCSTRTTSTRRCPGPWEWDLKRLAASVMIAGQHLGFSRKAVPPGHLRRRPAPTATPWPDFAAMGFLDALVRLRHRRRPALQHGPDPQGARRRVDRFQRRATRKTSLGALAKLAAEHRRRLADPQ